MRDPDIREALVAAVSTRLGPNHPRVLVPEVDVRWTVPARMDALLVSDRLYGFEIKSDVDSLSRLPHQVEAYGAVVERAVLVVGERHLTAASALVPDWWNIWVARWSDERVVLRQVRGGRLNPGINPLAVASFLGRDELTAVLRARGHVRLSARNVFELRELLAEDLTRLEMLRLTRASILRRADWRQRALLTV